MLFPTFSFAVFFIIVFTVSWALHKHEVPWKLFLLFASYYFYACWNVKYTILIFSITTINYVLAWGVYKSVSHIRAKLILTLAVFISLGTLGYFKYYSFFFESLNSFIAYSGAKYQFTVGDTLAIVGISFFTFQAISYTVDVYRESVTPDISIKGYLDFLVYISFFPQLVAGPIVRAKVFIPQLQKGVFHGIPDIHMAMSLILSGLFKKVIISTYLQVHLVDNVFATPLNHSPIEVLLGIYGFSVQIFCDFSGYSDIAIGCAMLLGIRFPDNFRNPYKANNIRDFWQRWHITLSTWLRDYLYIPLGGNRMGERKTMINLFLTMLLGGLWHGASLSFIVWGSLHGLFLVFHHIYENFYIKTFSSNFFLHKYRDLYNKVCIFLTFHLISFLWVFFYHRNLDSALDVFKGLFNFNKSVGPIEVYVILCIIIGIAIHFKGKKIRDMYLNFHTKAPFYLNIGLDAAIFISIIKLSPDIIPPFLYFQF
ncbi:MAG: MBOAT family protein [Deltaproteobacteria bacterium]|nr:MBOAT family protein [Deltaproteobacteria bacterium]